MARAVKAVVRPVVRARRPRHKGDAPPLWTAAQRRALRVQYGITAEQYEEMWHAQSGRCFLCGKYSRRQRLSVDHDHKTKRVRGLLCSRCNRALGHFEWDVNVLRRLITYAEATIADQIAQGVAE